MKRPHVTATQLIRHRGENSQAEQAALWNTPLPTYSQWERELRRIPGIVSVLMALERKLQRLLKQ